MLDVHLINIMVQEENLNTILNITIYIIILFFVQKSWTVYSIPKCCVISDLTLTLKLQVKKNWRCVCWCMYM